MCEGFRQESRAFLATTNTGARWLYAHLHSSIVERYLKSTRQAAQSGMRLRNYPARKQEQEGRRACQPTSRGLDHWAILTSDEKRCIGFYQDVLGLKIGPRPKLTFQGIWLYSGDTPIVHVISDRAFQQGQTGAFDHIAFAMEGSHTAMEKKLKANGIEYTSRLIERTGVYQIACHDPDGCGVELNLQGVSSTTSAFSRSRLTLVRMVTARGDRPWCPVRENQNHCCGLLSGPRLACCITLRAGADRRHAGRYQHSRAGRDRSRLRRRAVSL